MSLRNPHIALAVVTTILFGGGFLVRNAGEGAMQLIGVLALTVGFGTFAWLETRERRQQERDQ